MISTALSGPAYSSFQEIPTREVRLRPGASSGTVEDSVAGRQVIDYVLGAKQGQQLTVSMETRHPGAYFNLLAPGKPPVVFYDGSTNGNQYEATLHASGEFRIRVYLMRGAARRGEKAQFRLEIILDGRLHQAPHMTPGRTPEDEGGE